MFCKWCGAETSDTAGTCTRCGRELPVKSDCGGFYDLVFLPKTQTAEAVTARPEPVAEAAHPVHSTPVRGKKRKRRRGGLGLVLTGIGFLVVFMLLLSLNGKIKDLNAALETANGRIIQLETLLQKPAAEDLSVAEQKVSFAVVLDGTDAQVKADIGITKKVTAEKDTTVLAIGMEEDGECLQITLKNEEDGKVSAAFAATESVFGKAEGEASYRWFCQTAGTKDWSPVDAGMVSGDGTTVTWTGADAAELKLDYTRESTEGGALAVTVSGIQVTGKPAETKTTETQ